MLRNNYYHLYFLLAGGSDEDDEEQAPEDPGTRLQPTRVTSITFPTYVEPNVKDDMVSI